MFTKLFSALKGIDWWGAAKAAGKAVWPFVAGAFGGLLTGCSMFGSGVGVTI